MMFYNPLRIAFRLIIGILAVFLVIAVLSKFIPFFADLYATLLTFIQNAFAKVKNTLSGLL